MTIDWIAAAKKRQEDNKQILRETLTKIVDTLQSAGVTAMRCQAHGGGDEGCLDDPEFVIGTEEVDPDFGDVDIQSLLELAFNAKDFDYYNGEGGRIILDINVEDRSCLWSAYLMEEVSVETGEDEVTV